MHARCWMGTVALGVVALMSSPGPAAAQDSAKGYAFTPVLHSVSDSENLDATARTFLERFREISK